ncbi:MAG TPA: hypothetical protein VGF59_18840 [Bryobacteraceae bacterium]|jgi:hypothetical protein
MPKSRWSVFLSLLLVFLSGALVGAFAHRLYMVNTVQGVNPPRRPSFEEFRKHYMEDLRTTVKLDPQQAQQAEQILDEIRKDFDQLRDKQNAEREKLQAIQIEKMNAILSPEQQGLYTQFRARREAERKAHQKGGGPPPPPTK